MRKLLVPNSWDDNYKEKLVLAINDYLIEYCNTDMSEKEILMRVMKDSSGQVNPNVASHVIKDFINEEMSKDYIEGE